MKKNFIYALIACFTLSLAACSTDPEDATSKHVYGENENPYLKTNADAVVSTKAEFPISRLEAKTVKLTDYAEKFHTYLGMTVDETLAALGVWCFILSIYRKTVGVEPILPKVLMAGIIMRQVVFVKQVLV